jgi:hypothetical protein
MICSAGQPACPTAGQVWCDGSCVDPSSDPNHCGGCGHRVPTGRACAGGVIGCPQGEQPCDGKCVQTDSDPAHCGACNVAAPSGGHCQDGVPACWGSDEMCGSVCRDTQTDLKNCGGCGKVCPKWCEDGTCSIEVTATDATKTCNSLCQSKGAYCTQADGVFYDSICGSEGMGFPCNQLPPATVTWSVGNPPVTCFGDLTEVRCICTLPL